MSKVAFSYVKGGKTVLMARRYAETLRRLGHGTYPMGDQAPVDIQPKFIDPLEKCSEAVYNFAVENQVDPLQLVGTGKDGRIKKSDVEAVIASRDLV